MKDFDIAKYLREHQLGSYGILNHYVDLKPLKEEEDGAYDEQSEIPYEGPDDKLTGLGDGDSFDQADIVSEAAGRVEWEDLDHTDISGPAMEMDIVELIDRVEESIQIELTNDETVSQLNPRNPRQTAAQIRSLIKKLWMQKIQGWSGSNRGMEEGFGDQWVPYETSAASHKFIGGREAEDNTEILAKAIEALSKAGLTLDQIKAVASTIENDPETLEQALAFE